LRIASDAPDDTAASKSGSPARVATPHAATREGEFKALRLMFVVDCVDDERRRAEGFASRCG
jgi:hypothetical protein